MPVRIVARPVRCYAARGRRVKPASVMRAPTPHCEPSPATLALTPNPLAQCAGRGAFVASGVVLPSPRSEGRRAGDEGLVAGHEGLSQPLLDSRTDGGQAQMTARGQNGINR